MHRSTGKDAPRRGDAPLEWVNRKSEKHTFQMRVDPEFWSQVKEYCERRQISMSDLIRYLLAKEMEL